MITQSRVHFALIGLMLSLVFLLAVVAQVVVRAIQQGVGESKGIRVVAENACSTSTDGTHFVGCSSIL